MIWREEVRGAYPEPQILGLPGLEQIRQFEVRGGPIPPIGHLTGMRPTETGYGRSVFTMPASEWLLAPPGVIQGGVLAVLADGPLGSAVHTTLPAATPYTTSELSMSFVRPATTSSGLLTATGTIVHTGRRLGLSEVVVHDHDDRLLAHGTSRCFIFPALDPPPPPPPVLEPWIAPTYDSPDPYLRPVEGEVLPQEIFDRYSGLEIILLQIKGDLPRPPIHYLTGQRPIEASEGRVVFAMPCHEWLCSPARSIEGGFIAMLADSALSCAVQTTVPAGTAYATIDLKANFLRPVYPDGKELIATGALVHRGKTLAVASAEVVNTDGKRVMVATGTSMILPDRPASMARPVVPADDALA